MGKRVSEAEKQFIRDNFDKMSLVEIAQHLNRRPDHVGGIARKMGLRKLKITPWTKDEEDIIKMYFPEWGANKCCEMLPHRTREQIHWKAKRLGLYCNITKQRINLGIKHYNLEKNKSYGTQGYIVIRVNGKLRTEQAIIAEEILGRPLAENEVVHHINGIKDDNRLENLAVLNRSDHVKLHNGDTNIKVTPLSELVKR